MKTVRPPAVAGLFYPGDPVELRETVDRLLAAAAPRRPQPVIGIIAPHAGYVYSGPIAASAYALLAGCRDQCKRVALVGPSHFAGFDGVAAPDEDSFATPLGELPVDRECIDSMAREGVVTVFPEAHIREHSLETQLPFVQRALGDLPIVPMLVSVTSIKDVASALDRVWLPPDTVLIVSSDLSHYLVSETARHVDAGTANSIERLDTSAIGPERACGFTAIDGMLLCALHRGYTVERVDLRNSGDTAGPRDRVVGYGAFAIRESAK